MGILIIYAYPSPATQKNSHCLVLCAVINTIGIHTAPTSISTHSIWAAWIFKLLTGLGRLMQTGIGYGNMIYCTAVWQSRGMHNSDSPFLYCVKYTSQNRTSVCKLVCQSRTGKCPETSQSHTPSPSDKHMPFVALFIQLGSSKITGKSPFCARMLNLSHIQTLFNQRELWG